jgi:sugar/nucleoside kinase (ribokinase family)
MSKRWDILAAGEIYIDHIFTGFASWPDPGGEVFAPSYARDLGGGAAITACGLGRLGRAVAVLGMVGSEESAWIASVLAAHRVDGSALRTAAGHTGTTVSISTAADRSFFSYAGPNSLLPAWLLEEAVIERLTQARHVHLALAPPRDLAARLLPALRAAGTTVSLDPGWQPAWYDDPGNRATCREVDCFLPNQKEAAWITGLAPDQATPEELAAALLRAGFANTVVKLGSRGAIATQGGAICRVAAPAVQVVDTTGAGDAFDAGLIDALLDHAATETMLRRGCLLGSLSVRAAGALSGLPLREEIEEML